MRPQRPHEFCRDIFTTYEIEDIHNMLDVHRSLITPYDGPEKIHGASFGYFGAAWYNSHGYADYIEKGNSTREALNSEMPYKKIKDAIEEITGMSCEIAALMNPPGLHIFENFGDSAVTIPVRNWHQDMFGAGVYMSSWLVPIQLPKHPCGVDFMGDNGVERFNYEENVMYGWNGRMLHTISDMVLEPGEKRITLQCHTMSVDNQLQLFW